MAKNSFYIVDVFAEQKYAGNQLAVFRDAKGLADEDMQTFAKEMNYSETTFILSEDKRDGGYDVRIFTPAQELPFAGHPTLGTAFVIQKEIERQPVERVVLNLKVGQIPVEFKYKEIDIEIMWMKQINPTFGATFDTGTLSTVLSLHTSDINERYPIQEVSTGTPFIMVPLKTLDATKRATINKDRYFNLIKDAQAKAILIFCQETYCEANHLNVRVFADYYGVPEDPATGSANGCLAGYLAKHRYFGKERINVRVEQGHEIGRPSVLFLKAEDKKDKIDVFVGGRAVMVAKGEFI
ncbi:MAG: PhzF family phenazine biosynthesis isomerase [candidate division Zixibacteria bacterium]|nr:PhzF family phenazine biosynthesis isomerase [candidate division Zixibacteria bacterium]